MKHHIFLASATIFTLTMPAAAQYKVSPAKILTMPGFGEVQSAVVVNAKCPQGRLLITNDAFRPPASEAVSGYDLPSGTPAAKTVFHPDGDTDYSPDPNKSNEYFGMNDHDILTLDNGEVLLLSGVHLRSPLVSKPAWFDAAYHPNGFGPGTRRGTIVYHSSDCGATFQSCRRSTRRRSIAIRKTRRARIRRRPSPTLRIISRTADPTGSWRAGLPTARLPRYGLHRADASPGRDERKRRVVLSVRHHAGRAHLRALFRRRQTVEHHRAHCRQAWPGGGLSASCRAARSRCRCRPASPSGSRRATEPCRSTTSSPRRPICPGAAITSRTSPTSRVRPVPLLGRVPGDDTKVFLTETTKFTKAGYLPRYGYRLFIYDSVKTQLGAAAPILPPEEVSAKTIPPKLSSYILHPVAIDPGTGPVLLYWCDVDSTKGRVTIRGRFLLANGASSDDFTVAVDAAIGLPILSRSCHYRQACGTATTSAPAASSVRRRRRIIAFPPGSSRWTSQVGYAAIFVDPTKIIKMTSAR